MSLLQKKQQKPSRRNDASSARQTRASSSDLNERYAFRRNRTLTGSLAPGVASVGEHRAELKSSRVHAHGLRRHRRRLTVFLAVLLLVSTGLLALIYQSVAIPHVVAATVKPLDSNLYAEKIQDYLSIHPLERFRFTLSADNLATYLQNNGCPEVASVSPDMQYDGIGASKISLQFRRAAVSWRTAGSQLYVDETGAAFTRNYYEEPTVQVVDKTGIVAKDNQVLASNRFLGFIGTVIGKMKQYGYTVTSVTLPEATTRQIAVTLEGLSYPIKLSVDRPIGEQAEDASRSIHYLQAKGITPEYLDVRVSGRAFYK
jgi:hypothetical protein